MDRQSAAHERRRARNQTVYRTVDRDPCGRRIGSASAAPRALTLRFALSLSQTSLGEGRGALRAGSVGAGEGDVRFGGGAGPLPGAWGRLSLSRSGRGGRGRRRCALRPSATLSPPRAGSPPPQPLPERERWTASAGRRARGASDCTAGRAEHDLTIRRAGRPTSTPGVLHPPAKTKGTGGLRRCPSLPPRPSCSAGARPCSGPGPRIGTSSPTRCRTRPSPSPALRSRWWSARPRSRSAGSR